jgi:hypothetical protein
MQQDLPVDIDVWCLIYRVQMLLIRTLLLPKAAYACRNWGPDMLPLSPRRQPGQQSELLPISKYVLGIRALQ